MIRFLFLLLACLAAGPAFALNILLTNDDGWQAPGIQSLFKTLTAAVQDPDRGWTYGYPGGPCR